MKITVCCLSKNCWWILFIIFHLTFVALEIASLATSRWLSQGKSPSDWEGGLLKPTSDSNLYPDSKSYAEQWDDCNDGSSDLYDSQCLMFKNLRAGGVIYILFESFSLFFIVATILVLLLDIGDKTRHLWFACLFYWIATLWHFFGFVIWSGLAMMFFKDDCDSYIWGEPDVNDEPARTCGEEGPAIALATVLWMFVTCILFTVVYCSVKKQNTIKDLNEMQPEPVAEETETNRKQKLKKKLDKV